MSRRLLIAVVAPVLGAALIAPAAASAQPTPTPTGPESPGMTTSPQMTTPPAPPPATDTTSVCKNVQTTLNAGWPAFEASLSQARNQLSQRDLNGTQASLKQAGQQLQAMGAQVKHDGSQASDANLKSTVTALGAEMASLGTSLNSLSSLKSFDPHKLTPLSKQLASTCKGQHSGAPQPS
jgi:hypothetical protein